MGTGKPWYTPGLPVTISRLKRMEDGDESGLRNWRMWRKLGVKKYQSKYERLNVKFDVCTGESLVGQESMADSLQKLEDMGLGLKR